MFDFAWSEFALIGVLALVLIGPKDLPVAIKAASQALKKARRMAGEFQTHVDDLVREANLQEVRDGLANLRSMDIKGQILKAVDDDGSIRSSLTNPLSASATDFSPAPPPVPVHDAAESHSISGDTLADHALSDDSLSAGLYVPAETPLPETEVDAAEAAPPPAFVPPNYVPKPPRPLPPAFVPPGFAQPAAARQAKHA